MLIEKYLPGDFNDSFSCEAYSETPLSSEELMKTIFTNQPSWVNALYKLRGWLVKPFGLKGGTFDGIIDKLIKETTTDETVIYINDKHLAFYASVFIVPVKENTFKATITTVVNFHNLLGRVYFFFICPFHKIVVSATLKRAIKRIK